MLWCNKDSCGFSLSDISYSQPMQEWVDSLLMHATESVHGNIRRLCRISPWFSGLVRTLSDDERRALFQPLDLASLPNGCSLWVPPCDHVSLPACMQHLRRCKQRGTCHLIWWELGLHGDIGVSACSIADFASALLQQACYMAKHLLSARYGTVADGQFSVIGLGKLGGRELNLGSDVDLLFVWQGEGKTHGGRQSVPVAEYYQHLARMLIRLMSERTADGLVWPVDMRLRPGGGAASIALSLDATLGHYLDYGQTWERAMLLKARHVAGDRVLGEAFLEGIQPFIYRRYLDYTTVAALADMKSRIDVQAGRGSVDAGFDVKRGRGGIREIEFIIQSLQLLHGGRQPELRVQPSLEALVVLQQQQVLDEETACGLRDAYRFWRRIEHALQARHGEQTQKLPQDYKTYLAEALGVEDIHQHMKHHALWVEQAFQRFVQPVRDVEESWLTGCHPLLENRGDKDIRRIRQALSAIDEQLSRGLLPERSRNQVERILTHAMPCWLEDDNGVLAIESFAGLIRSIAGRATWVDLLATHEGALAWLTGVLSASRYVAEHIVRDPSWLEWPLMTEHRDLDVRDACRQLKAVRDFDNVEQTLADLGRWVDRVRLMSALAVDAHAANAMTVGGWMADIADAACDVVLRLCLHEMSLPADFPFVALAMGKHGSREMGLVSDLDIVFILVDDHPSAMLGTRSRGEHAQRLGRRMIHYLTTKPPFGAGFDFDARLRPSGSSGVLVTSLAGFHDYQWHHAQLWEHQALCRARSVAGPVWGRQKVDTVVADILARPRDARETARAIQQMRQKMLDHLASRSSAVINLKQDSGGLVDIEFLAQFLRLTGAGTGRRVVDVLQSLSLSAPEAWQQHAGWLAETYGTYLHMDNVLRVELWRSVKSLPVNDQAAEWRSLGRHTDIGSANELKKIMGKVRLLFRQWVDS